MSLILSGSEGLSDVDGTAATPAIRGTDTNTGIFFPAADTIAFAEGGVESMRLDSSGNLGIGTSSPAVPLSVNTRGLYNLFFSTANDSGLSIAANNRVQGTSDLILVQQGGGDGYLWNRANNPVLFGTNNAERMRIDSSGNVGIGTSSPGQRLEVAGNVDITTVAASGNGLRIRTPSGSGSPAILQFTNNPVTSQWGYISATSADVMTIGGSAEFVRISGSNFQFNSGYGSVATAYGCRAWVNFNGTGTVAIRGSGNVSSITDLGVGSYQINIATAMPDANYTVVGASTSVVGVATTDVVTTFRRDTDVRVANTTTATTISTCNSNNSTALDCVDVNISIFR